MVGHAAVGANNSIINYFYQLTDHLGNVRVVLNEFGEVVQKADYYPFGMMWQGTFETSSGNKYLYNGKEMQDELGWYDYGARFYGIEGRFTTMDPMAEKYPWQSPYCYAANNPIKNIDYNGKNPVVIIGGIALTAADVALISLGVVTSGIILHQAHDGSLAFNQNIVDYWSSLNASWNSGYEWQQRQGKAAKAFNDALDLSHQQMLKNNMGNGNNDENKYKTGGALAISLGIMELYLNTRDLMNQAKATVGQNISGKQAEIKAIKNNNSLTPQEKQKKIEALQNDLSNLGQQQGDINDALDYTNNAINQLNNQLHPTAAPDATRVASPSEAAYQQMMQDLKNW
ncbi:MAG: hypothetical protein HC896_09835 [Bacteroidales bacterium]|nr:hypothetical protein [Bacteroidales bacterium]